VLLIVFPGASEPFLAIVVAESASAVPFSADELALIDFFFVWPFENTLPVHFICLPFTLVGVPVGPFAIAPAFDNVFFEVAAVFGAVGEKKCSIPLLLPLTPQPFILRPIPPHLLPLPMIPIILKISLINRTIPIRYFPLTLQLKIFPRPLKHTTIYHMICAIARDLIISPRAKVITLVIENAETHAFAKA